MREGKQTNEFLTRAPAVPEINELGHLLGQDVVSGCAHNQLILAISPCYNLYPLPYTTLWTLQGLAFHTAFTVVANYRSRVPQPCCCFLVCSCLFSLMYLLTCCLYTCYASPICMFTCNAHKLGLLNHLHIMWSRLGPIVQCSGCRVTSVSYSNLSLHYLQLHKKFIFYAYNYIATSYTMGVLHAIAYYQVYSYKQGVKNVSPLLELLVKMER